MLILKFFENFLFFFQHKKKTQKMRITSYIYNNIFETKNFSFLFILNYFINGSLIKHNYQQQQYRYQNTKKTRIFLHSYLLSHTQTFLLFFYLFIFYKPFSKLLKHQKQKKERKIFENNLKCR